MTIRSSYNIKQAKLAAIEKQLAHPCFRNSNMYDIISPTERAIYEKQFLANDEQYIEYLENQKRLANFDKLAFTYISNLDDEIKRIKTGKSSSECYISFESFDALYMENIAINNKKEKAESRAKMYEIFILVDKIIFRK